MEAPNRVYAFHKGTMYTVEDGDVITTLGKKRQYLVSTLLSKRTFGPVISVVHKQSNINYAIKVVDDDAMINEINILKIIRRKNDGNHNIVKCIDIFDENDAKHMVFELLSVTLHDYLHQHTPTHMPLHQIRSVLSQTLNALDSLRTWGIMHGDISADNIMVENVNGPIKVKLIDFGSALIVEDETRHDVEQPADNRAPEVYFQLESGPPIDIWSLGCVAVHLFTKKVLFDVFNRGQDCVGFMFVLLGKPPVEFQGRGCFNEFFEKDYSFKHDNAELLIKEREQAACGTFQKIQAFRENQTGIEKTDTIEFMELLKQFLKWKPEDRLIPKDAMDHDFFKMMHLTSNEEYLNAAKNEMNGHKEDSSLLVPNALPIPASELLNLPTEDEVDSERRRMGAESRRRRKISNTTEKQNKQQVSRVVSNDQPSTSNSQQVTESRANKRQHDVPKLMVNYDTVQPETDTTDSYPKDRKRKRTRK